MEMFLAVAALSLVGVAVSTILFAAATRGLPAEPHQQPVERVAIPAPRFFAETGRSVLPVAPAQPAIPIEALLLQIERHVRLEEAAAEAFHLSPTAESLHSRTMSPLVH